MGTTVQTRDEAKRIARLPRYGNSGSVLARVLRATRAKKTGDAEYTVLNGRAGIGTLGAIDYLNGEGKVRIRVVTEEAYRRLLPLPARTPRFTFVCKLAEICKTRTAGNIFAMSF